MEACVTTDLLLGPMLRFVDDRSATIWVETSDPCEVKILESSSRTFTVAGHHYALVILSDLEPGTTVEYEVAIDGATVWPKPGSNMPPSVIRTQHPNQEVSLLLGSCRAAAPHEPPYTLELTFNDDGRGVDTLWAHAKRMATEDPSEWPDLLVLLGDQIYADDSSPQARERIEARRSGSSALPAETVADFEEYCWLYREAWSLSAERWLLSVVPSVMIFDDHDMIDDWNISASWVADIRKESWWNEHAIGGLVSYWVYQHLGNLSPAEIEAEGILSRAEESEDATAMLRDWAIRSEASTPLPGGYRFSFVRRVGDVTVVVIDCRNARVLTDDSRRMVGGEEWRWVTEQAAGSSGHVVLATSVPVFIPDGLHDLHVWNERLCGGALGRRAARLGERVRRYLDLEDWPAFMTSYTEFVALVEALRSDPDPPKSITVASGDIHFSFAAKVLASTDNGPSVWQVVSSPIRNALIPPERSVMRFTLTKAGRRIGALLRRSVRGRDTRPRLQLRSGPFFANNMSGLRFSTSGVVLTVAQSTLDDDGTSDLVEVARLQLD